MIYYDFRRHPNIRFTVEVEMNRKLPFLNMLIRKKPHGTLGHSMDSFPSTNEGWEHAAPS